jgi:adenine deaminase
MNRKELLAVARGEVPADLLLTGGRVVNVFTGEVEEVDVAVAGGWIAGVGPGYRARNVLELDGAHLLPGLIDAHVHIESSLCAPPEFARAVVPRGTTTVISDPHEIANVHGIEGIRWMLDASEGLPLTVLVMASSCVPATHMGTAGAELDADALVALLAHPRVLGLAEVMNFPGVIHGDDGVLAKLEAFRGRPVDGHAPGVAGRALNAYVAAGPSSDHECTTPEEAREKLRRGLFVLLREATNARNLRALIPALTPASMRRTALCTDDRQPPDLVDEGGIDAMLRILVEEGVDPAEAVRMATLNPSEHYGLRDRGAIAPGRRADLVVVEDLRGFRVREVFSAGVVVARDGQALAWPEARVPGPPPPSMRVDPATVSMELVLPAGVPPFRAVRVIRAIPDQIVTGHEQVVPRVEEGRVVPDPSRDLLKIVVMERHRGTGRCGAGLVTGLGLGEGALAGTVAHDHHNLIAAGADDRSIRTAAVAVAGAGGGLAVARGDEVLALLPLPVGGLMSLAPLEEVRAGLDRVVAAARSLGSPLHDPFMALSFLGLEVIPSLRITDLGLVDVERFAPVGLWVDDPHPAPGSVGYPSSARM